jgi:hypothetical protein
MATGQLRGEIASVGEFRTRLHPASLGAGAWGTASSLLVAWLILQHNELGPSAASRILVYGVLIGFGWLVLPAIRYWATEFVVNESRIEVRSRPFMTTRYAQLEDVEGVAEHAGGVARQLGYGTVVIRGRGGTGATLRHVRNAGGMCRAIAEKVKSRSRGTG